MNPEAKPKVARARVAGVSQNGRNADLAAVPLTEVEKGFHKAVTERCRTPT